LIEKKDSQNDSIVVHTSVLLEYLEDTPLGKKVFQKVLSNEEIKKFYIASIVDTELKYILCRRKGYGKGCIEGCQHLGSELAGERMHLYDVPVVCFAGRRRWYS